MKKLLVWVLLLSLCLGLFAGCKGQEPDTNKPDVQVQQEDSKASVTNALAYVKNMYKNAEEKTAIDYKRIGVVTIGGKQFQVVWTTDAAEENVKIVKEENGMYTIDVNEQAAEDVPYTLTATVTDENGKSESYTWNHILPKAVDMGQIVDEAYALKSGESMDHPVTLTGEVLSVKTPYDPGYKNITVIIEVAVRPGKTIECYRLKGEGVEDLAIGDTITVTGTIKNYNGTIEFDAGCICTGIVPGERVEAPTDMKQIVDEAYALGANKSLPYEAKLTGVITQVKDAYDAGYKNISVIIAVEGRESKPILAYRMKGDNIDKIGVNDIITVTGYITNYVGTSGHSTIEYTAGCQLVAWEDKAGPVIPSTMQEIVDQAYALGANDTLKYEAKLTGTITKVKTAYDPGYDNVSVEFVVAGREDKPILAYRMKGTGASVIGVGDVITVNGYITNYVGSSGYSTIEYTAGCKLLSYIDNADPTPEVPEVEGATVVEEIAADTAYKFAVNQKNEGGLYFFDGTLASGKYLGATKDAANAVDVFVEETTGGYYLYFMNGDVKTYITMEEYYKADKGYYSANVVFTTDVPSIYYTWNNTIKTIVTNTGNDIFCFGTYGNYTTISCTSDYYFENADAVDQSQFIGRFYIVDEDYTEPEEPVEPDVPTGEVDATVVEQPVADTAYKFAMFQAHADVNKIYYFNGTLDREKYLGTTENAAEAVDVYIEIVEDVEGAAYLYFMDGDVKTYITMEEYLDGSYYKAKAILTTEAPSVYFKWNEDLKTVVCETGNDYFCFGTYSTFTTFSCTGSYYVTGNNAANVDVTQFIGRFYTVEITEPEEDFVLTVEEAIALGTSKAHDTFTTEKYSVTGVITEVYNTQYGNMRITDEAGNILTIYGTYSADGANRYDAMSVKPVAGDTVTIYGIVGQYNGTPQIKNGWITEHIPAGSEPEQPPVNPEEPPVEEPEVETELVAEPVADTAYKFAMNQVTAGKLYYFNGALSGKYLNTTENAAEAVDVYIEMVEDVEGAAYLYFMDGDVKTYITMEEYLDGSYYKAKAIFSTEAPSVYFKWNEDLKTVVCETGNDYFCYGTYGTYTTFGCTGSYYVTGNNAANVDVSQFIGRFYAVVEEETPEEPETPAEPEEPASDTLSIADAIALGAGMEKDNYTTEKYYVTGVITEIKNATYGNVYITDGEGNFLYVYGLNSADGSTRYDAMNPKPDEGDTVTLYGVIGMYTDPQMKAAWVIDFTPGELEEEEPDAEAVTIAFDNKSKRSTFTTSKQVWAENGITVTNNKGASTSNVADYAAPARFYKSSTVIVEYANGFTKIEFACNTASYATALKSSIKTGTVTVENTKVIVVLDAAATSFEVVLDGGQVRMDSLTVS